MQPSTHPLISGVDCPWLPPISFGIEPYLQLCRTIHESLKELEARYPTQRPLLTWEGRAKRLKHKPK
ncbi:MAG TPA: hypothetical protein VH107_08385 [Lacipirellulaceae bacterium]|nr:hypothetical protein [Lacipirellulaceae bacterium]